MTVTNTAAFGQVPNVGTAILTAAKTNPFSGATGTVLAFTPGANGSILTGIQATPRDTFTGGIIVLYTSPDGGTTLNMLTAAALAAYTYGATTALSVTSFLNLNGVAISVTNPFYMKTGVTLYASSTVALANGILVTADGVDL